MDKLYIDSNWIKRMAKKEDGKMISAGGLAHRIGDDLTQSKGESIVWRPISEAPKDGTAVVVYGTWMEPATGRNNLADGLEIGCAKWVEPGHPDFMHDGWMNNDGYYEIIWTPVAFCIPPDISSMSNEENTSEESYDKERCMDQRAGSTGDDLTIPG